MIGIVKWAVGFATHLLVSFKIYTSLKKGEALEKFFFRSKLKEGEYYSAKPQVSTRFDNHVITWILKKVGNDEKIVVNSNDLIKNFESCPPYEALGSHLV